ncbi:MAG: FG-GAP-like repeat-containing protein [Fimbriiglobus sp.]
MARDSHEGSYRNPQSCRFELEALDARVLPSVTLRFDYTYDTSGFFRSAEARAALEAAAAQIAPLVEDNLSAVRPTGNNTWTAQFYNPIRATTVNLTNYNINQNEIVVFVGATNLYAGELGLTTSGGYTATGDRAWLNTVKGRGQTGTLSATKTDYSTWGGMITFDADSKWNFGNKAVQEDEFDFTSVALHEIMHIFGFGLGEPAFTRHISNGLFNGPNATSVYGKGIPVVGDPPDHFAPGVEFEGSADVMQPSLLPGTRRRISTFDKAVLADIGWDISSANIRTTGRESSLSPVVANIPAAAPAMSTAPVMTPVAPIPAAQPVVSSGRFAVGTVNMAMVYGASGELIRSYVPYGSNFTGGVRVLMSDVTGDGNLDLLTATGAGMTGMVYLFDGVTGNQLAWLQPFETSFTGGLHIASADLNADGKEDLVVTPDDGGGAIVTVFDGSELAQGRMRQWNRFYGLNDSNFRGGVRPSLGDLNNDGTPDLVVSAGLGGGPRVAMIDGRTIGVNRIPVNLTGDFFAFESSLRNGVYLTVEDINGDGFDDVVAGAGPGGGPRVTSFDGRSLLAGRQQIVNNYFVGETNNRNGVRVANTDLDADGRPELLATSGDTVSVYRSTVPGIAPPFAFRLTIPNPAGPDGLHVG